MATKNSPKELSASRSALPYVRTLVWPCLVLIGLFLFRDQIAGLFPRIKEINFDSKTMKIALNLTAAEASEPSGMQGNKTVNTNEILDIAKAAKSTNLEGARVLWVDDSPDNNIYERQALGALGIEFVLAHNTSEAEFELRKTKFNAIISDFNRADDPQGGYTLLDRVMQLPSRAPYIIYSTSVTPEYEAAAKHRGAFAETNRPRKLFDIVIEAIKQ